MKTFFEILIVSTFYIGLYLLSYIGAFHVCLSDDVEFNYGKTRMRNRRKKAKGFWRKFLFLDVRNEVIMWHYVMFWINLIFSFAALIALYAAIVFRNDETRLIFIILYAPAFISSAIITCCRWPLYAGNKVRSRKKYRKNH